MKITHRPSEGEGQHELAPFWVGEGEGVLSEDDAGCVAEGAGSGAGDVALVLLQAEAEEGVAGRDATGGYGGTGAAAAALSGAEFAPGVRHLEHLELEEAGSIAELEERRLWKEHDLLYLFGCLRVLGEKSHRRAERVGSRFRREHL